MDSFEERINELGLTNRQIFDELRSTQKQIRDLKDQIEAIPQISETRLLCKKIRDYYQTEWTKLNIFMQNLKEKENQLTSKFFRHVAICRAVKYSRDIMIWLEIAHRFGVCKDMKYLVYKKIKQLHNDELKRLCNFNDMC